MAAEAEDPAEEAVASEAGGVAVVVAVAVAAAGTNRIGY
jgi:hypothetical protein